MSNPVFPTLADGQDSKLYSVEAENPAIKTETDGGYVISRAKHTRKPRKTFTTGYTSISDADKKKIEAFYDLVRGGSVIFDWEDTESGLTHQVRFSAMPNYKYKGAGLLRRWDVAFSVEQA
jgi:hypothetical protein